MLVNGAARAYHFALDEYVHYTARGNAIGGAGNAVVTDIARGRRAPHTLVAVVVREQRCLDVCSVAAHVGDAQG